MAGNRTMVTKAKPIRNPIIWNLRSCRFEFAKGTAQSISGCEGSAARREAQAYPVRLATWHGGLGCRMVSRRWNGRPRGPRCLPKLQPSSSVLCGGMAATIAGQATMAINARAINRLCIAVSYFGFAPSNLITTHW